MPKEKIRWYYKGPVKDYYNRVLRNPWEDYKEATSEKHALSLMARKFREEFYGNPDAHKVIKLDPQFLEVSIKHPNEDDFKNAHTLLTCPDCGTQFYDDEQTECPECGKKIECLKEDSSEMTDKEIVKKLAQEDFDNDIILGEDDFVDFKEECESENIEATQELFDLYFQYIEALLSGYSLQESINKETTYLYYPKLTIEIPGKYHQETWSDYGGEPAYYEDEEEEIEYEYKVDKDIVKDALYDILIDDMDIETQELVNYIDSNYDKLLDDYSEKLLKYFEKDAKEQAEENYMNESLEKDGILSEELEAGDCAYHPEKDEYFYLKKTDNPNTFELYTHSDSRGFEVASPRFIDKNSPFYNKLKLKTKNANPEFKELKEDIEKKYYLCSIYGGYNCQELLADDIEVYAKDEEQAKKEAIKIYKQEYDYSKEDNPFGLEAEIVSSDEDDDLEEAIEKHNELNPKLFDGEELKPEVKEAIQKIVDTFIKELHEDGIRFNLKDIILVGSNVSYNYTKDSDLDIHIIADSEGLECPDNLYPLLYSAYRSIFNKNYDISIKGIPAG